MLIGASSQAIKSYCKRELELTALTEYYSGDTTRDIVTWQRPILTAQTTIATASNGIALPTSTIYVNSTQGFDPGTWGNTNATPPTIGIQTGVNQWTTVTYTGVTPNYGNPSAAPSFTGCQGGVGTLTNTVNQCQVYAPVVFYDSVGFFGQAQNAFQQPVVGNGCQLVLGSQYVVYADKGGNKSHRGIIRRIGGIGGIGFGGFWGGAEIYGAGKLGAQRLPVWPRGDGNIKVCYSAGYYPIPFDLQYACAMLVCEMVRIMPTGSPLASEGLGSYSYSILTQALDIPAIGTIQKTLSFYRESSFAYG
jgi:hypothetical protein